MPTKNTKIATQEETASVAKKAQEQKRKFAEQAKSSLVPNKLGVRETTTILKGKDHSYDLVLEFPGTAVAMTIIEEAQRPNSRGYYPSDMIEGAVNADVIKYPIELAEQGLDFFDSHDGSGEVAGAILNFLGEKLG